MDQFKRIVHPEAQRFTCGRCGKEKVSKNVYEWTSADETKLICNGCYGHLLSTGVK